VPGLNRLAALGELFKYRNDNSSKSELVIFLRPTVLNDASVDADFRDFRPTLPSSMDAMRPPARAGSSAKTDAQN